MHSKRFGLIFLVSFFYFGTLHANELSTLYKKVSPSVVVLHTFESMPSRSGNTRLTNVEGLGSGVVISADGKILTAAHVVQIADAVHVEFQNGDKALAKVVASIPSADLALLQLTKTAGPLAYVPLGDSDTMNVGDDVFIVGAPYGISNTLTAGFISGRHEAFKQSGFTLGEFFQTDAAINQGNSGGPMFNMNGEIVGVVSHILSKSGGYEGIGFAVTSNSVKKLLLEEPRFWTGVDGVLLTDELAQVLNLPQSAGLLIERVAAKSPAEKAGISGGTIQAKIKDTSILLGGDIILSVEGIAIEGADSYDKIRKAILAKAPNYEISVKILRKGKAERVNVILKDS